VSSPSPDLPPLPVPSLRPVCYLRPSS
jgi:hypothetical protein